MVKPGYQSAKNQKERLQIVIQNQKWSQNTQVQHTEVTQGREKLDQQLLMNT